MSGMVIPGIVAAGVPKSISLSKLALVNGSQGMKLRITDFWSPGVGVLTDLVYDAAGNSTYPWRVDDAYPGVATKTSGLGGGGPPYAGGAIRCEGTVMGLPASGLWYVACYAGGFDGTPSIYGIWCSDGPVPSDGNGYGGVYTKEFMWANGDNGYVDTAWHQIDLSDAERSSQTSSIWVEKGGSASGGLADAWWEARPIRIKGP